MKTKRTYVIFALGMLLSMAAWAQQVKWGPIQKEKAKIVVTDVVSHKPDQTIVMKAKGRLGLMQMAKGYQLERLNANFSSTLISKLQPMYEDKSLDIEFAFESNGQIYVFCSFANRKLDKRFLFLQRVNATSLQLEGALQKIAELSFVKRYRAGSFGYTFSRDSSHVMIYANTELKKNEPEKYGLYIFDRDFEPVWDKEVTLPYTESQFEVQDFTLDNDGNAFILGIKGQARGESRRRGSPSYEYRILGYRDDGADVEEYEVRLGDMFLTDMRIDVSPKRDIVCAGFYSEQGTWSIKGTYYIRIDRKTKEIEKMSAKEFDLDFITMNFTQRQEKKAKKRQAKGKNVELYEYDLREIVPRADGGAVLMAEQYYVTVICRTDPKTGVTTCTYYYHYNDVIVVSIDKGGDIEWATKVPKRQTSVNDGGYYSSFVSMVTNENLYLVYNDNKNNLQPDLKQGMFYNFSLRDKNGIVVLATIDADGQVTRKALFPNTEIAAITVPKLCKQVNKRQLLMYAKVRKGSQFGLVTF
jgi:hypothetical protein